MAEAAGEGPSPASDGLGTTGTTTGGGNGGMDGGGDGDGAAFGAGTGAPESTSLLLQEADDVDEFLLEEPCDDEPLPEDPRAEDALVQEATTAWSGANFFIFTLAFARAAPAARRARFLGWVQRSKASKISHSSVP